jgi:cyclase
MRLSLRLLPALLVVSVASLGAQAPADQLVMRIREVAPRFQLISGFTNGNLLAFVGQHGVLLVDGQTEKRVGLADSALRTVTRLPVQVLVNTHFHEDHISGNPHWRAQGARIIAQENLRALALVDTTITELEWHRTPAAPAALPDQTFRDSLAFEFDGEPVVLLHPVAAHTAGDAIIWFPRANVMHTGDILEREAPPFTDWWGGGSFEGMIRSMDLVLAHINDSTVVIPGHGTPTNRAGVVRYRTMLVLVRDTINAGFKAGKTIDQIIAEHPLAAYESELGKASWVTELFKRLALGWPDT